MYKKINNALLYRKPKLQNIILATLPTHFAALYTGAIQHYISTALYKLTTLQLVFSLFHGEFATPQFDT